MGNFCLLNIMTVYKIKTSLNTMYYGGEPKFASNSILTQAYGPKIGVYKHWTALMEWWTR